MIRTLLAPLFFLAACSTSLYAQQAVFGTVVDELGDPIIGGNVGVYNGDDLITGTQTDFDGAYRINLDPGTYNVEFSYVGYTPRRVDGFQVLVGQENKLNMNFEDDGGIELETAIVTAYTVDPMRVDETSQGITLTSEDVKQLGTRNINAIASLSAGASSADEGGAVNIRGGRSDATQYIIDGIRVTGALIPETEIDQIQVVTGGVEAKYGDLSGGIISITTKGPSSEFNGFVEAETSSFLDPYNNNLVGLSLSGPILKRVLPNGRKQTTLGYRFSGRYTYQEDDDAPATSIFQAREDVKDRLRENPIRRLPTGGFAQEAAFLQDSDVEALDAKTFEDYTRTDLTGKVDARISDAIDITLTGTLADESNRFTPNGGSATEANWRLLNAQNNPYDDDLTYRGNLRFRHRLGNTSNSLDTSSLISNALYTVQLGYQRNTNLLQDTRHQENFFDYGYIGKFDYENVPVFDDGQFNNDFDNPAIIGTQIGYRQEFRGYTPGTQNPVLAAYNKLGGDGTDNVNPDELLLFNGVQTSLVSDGVYTLHSPIGQIYNLYSKSQNDLITFNLQTQFDLRPAAGRGGTHNVQLGVLYEQRINRSYSLNPRNLWQLAGNLANAQLQTLDTTNVVDVISTEVNIPGLGLVPYSANVFAYEFNEDGLSRDSRFYRSIRQSLGRGDREFVNIDGLEPGDLDLSQFSAVEATSSRGTNRVNLDYAGYDYLGNIVNDGTAWDDFFTTRDANGNRTFPVAPISPIYFGGYLQDKFSFRNIILRAGVRVDYFDANTKVLRDPYELYDVQTAGDFQFEDGDVRPANIPDEAKVYIESPDNRQVKAYRVEDTWFTADGRQVNRAAEIFTGTQVPAYVDGNASSGNSVDGSDTETIRGENYIRSNDFNPDASFEDYEAQINFMPRLAFSFPLSDNSNFFAHYDVLVQRPPSNTVATALDYYYWFDNLASTTQNNPNLKPTRTIDYEAGFQQRISAASALKLSFFVREMRDMVQRRTYLFAMGSANRYTTYDNQDFGTVKGLNVSYDLRRTGPISLRVAYSLQFADGTGSDANSQSAGALARGNLRTLYPLSYDERHRVSGSIDYRYGRGEGPTIGGLNIFENTGINLFGSAVSGRPYTRLIAPTQLSGRANEGDINGARLPWNLVMNLRVDRNVSLFNENGKGINANVYLRVSNLFDRRNIISVYPVTGEPDDDGFLASARGEQVLSAQIDREAFERSYQWRLLNPNFFSLPRRMFLGASFAF